MILQYQMNALNEIALEIDKYKDLKITRDMFDQK
jgi:hypothetical protein